MNFNTIKRNFDSHLWTIAMVRMAVRKGIITKDEFKTITGNEY